MRLKAGAPTIKGHYNSKEALNDRSFDLDAPRALVFTRLCTSVTMDWELIQVGVCAYEFLTCDAGNVGGTWVGHSHNHGPRRVQDPDH